MLLLLTGCRSMTELSPDKGESRGDIAVQLTVSGTGADTRSLQDSPAESEIHDVKVFVMRMEGGEEILDSYYYYGEEPSITVYINPDKPADSYRFVTYVNHPSISHETIMQDWADLADESPDSFQMYGMTEKTVDEIMADPRVSVGVGRYVSKISVEKITLDWRNSSNSQKDFCIKGIYLTDVPGTMAGYRGVPEDRKKDWYNKNGWTTSGRDDLLHDAVEMTKLDNGQTYSQKHTYYAYVSDLQTFNTDSDWKKGGTRLVIEAEFDGKPCFYHLQISDGTLDPRNKHFVFEEIVITKPGADTPYGEYVIEEPIVFSISVNNWTVINKGTIVID